MSVDITKQGILEVSGGVGANIIAGVGVSNTPIDYTYPSSSYSDRFSCKTLIVPSASQYTLSFYAKSTVAGDKVRAHFYNPNTTTKAESSQGKTTYPVDGNMTFTLSTEWELYWVVYTQSSTTATKSVIFPRMGSVADQPSMSGTGTVSIWGLKLEEGAHPTPFTYANTAGNYIGEGHGFIEVPKESASINENFVVANDFIEW